ncbi:MAG: HAMP domain-containing histidine kinase [Muribaculaceae bacterium]|nr:HAMP domain-containing histidine kinase [Muribaculaceae bacterium]
MKKSLIWLLTAVMAITFGALLYFQITYLDNMVRMREAQFSEGVMRSLGATGEYLERLETLHFLEEDANIIESSFYDNNNGNQISFSLIQDTTGYLSVEIPEIVNRKESPSTSLSLSSPTQNLGERYRQMQETIRKQYLYQKGLLNEVILTILRQSGKRPALERADSTEIRKSLTRELAANGLSVPFVFAVKNFDNQIIYQTNNYDNTMEKGVYSTEIFANSMQPFYLTVEFPTKENYIFSSVRFIIPTLALTIILIVVFLFTIILIFRQKKLSEMKTDFINNMTHELKTPISTISLAGQMLNDDSVKKSESTLKHLSQVIIDESKRLRFQVDKVLQLSVFDNAGGALKFSTFDANTVISNVVNTFKIKVEKFGGSIICNLEASESEIYVDEMQFTNVISNLLDNAVKYRREGVQPLLEVCTKNLEGNRLQIRIKDNGTGIKKEHLKKIFEKFYRVPTGNLHNVKGFGLGLAYIKKMVSIFGGTVYAESEFEKWTEFTIILPLATSNQK